jgi:hypothetical protein
LDRALGWWFGSPQYLTNLLMLPGEWVCLVLITCWQLNLFLTAFDDVIIIAVHSESQSRSTIGDRATRQVDALL